MSTRTAKRTPLASAIATYLESVLFPGKKIRAILLVEGRMKEGVFVNSFSGSRNPSKTCFMEICKLTIRRAGELGRLQEATKEVLAWVAMHKKLSAKDVKSLLEIVFLATPQEPPASRSVIPEFGIGVSHLLKPVSRFAIDIGRYLPELAVFFQKNSFTPTTKTGAPRIPFNCRYLRLTGENQDIAGVVVQSVFGISTAEVTNHTLRTGQTINLLVRELASKKPVLWLVDNVTSAAQLSALEEFIPDINPLIINSPLASDLVAGLKKWKVPTIPGIESFQERSGRMKREEKSPIQFKPEGDGNENDREPVAKKTAPEVTRPTRAEHRSPFEVEEMDKRSYTDDVAPVQAPLAVGQGGSQSGTLGTSINEPEQFKAHAEGKSLERPESKISTIRTTVEQLEVSSTDSKRLYCFLYQSTTILDIDKYSTHRLLVAANFGDFSIIKQALVYLRDLGLVCEPKPEVWKLTGYGHLVAECITQDPSIHASLNPKVAKSCIKDWEEPNRLFANSFFRFVPDLATVLVLSKLRFQFGNSRTALAIILKNAVPAFYAPYSYNSRRHYIYSGASRPQTLSEIMAVEKYLHLDSKTDRGTRLILRLSICVFVLQFAVFIAILPQWNTYGRTIAEININSIWWMLAAIFLIGVRDILVHEIPADLRFLRWLFPD
ncbi:MAG: hypothetical protein EPO32_10215 [Anaerolineae bacterium]|nr:MAG: hypothetical protein EPO32_10215 [Anaerolineae bacterium]